MRPPAGARRQDGLTFLELLIAMVVLGILLAVGIPNMQGWLASTSANGAAQFYVEGFQMARNHALSNNSRSRLVFTANAQSGQRDWQVDVCFPIATDNCEPASLRWSSVDQAAASPEGGDVDTLSVHRSAVALPRSGMLSVTPDSDAESVYFTPLGWVDGGKPSVTRLDLAPGSANGGAFPSSAVVLTLAGTVTTCKPDALAGDSRRCP